MSILIDENTKVLVQGITGSFGARHAKLSLEYGTQIVAGVTPTKGGQMFENTVPIFDTVGEAVKETGATASAIFVPPAFAADAILEAADAGVDLIVCITEGIPVMDMMRVKSMLAGSKSRLVGPNCPGLVTPGHGEKSHGGCRIGIAPGYIHKRGNVAVWQLTQLGYGQSTCVGIGGDPINGTSHKDVLEMFNEDPETEAIIMIGEIGGTAEVEAARWAREHCGKPIAGFIAGATAPPGRRMGHAGAIVGGEEDTAQAKKKILAECGIAVSETPSAMAKTLLERWGR
jgi:succinyl-CoA synthetase alpha subunit